MAQGPYFIWQFSCHLTPLLRRDCGKSAEWSKVIRQTSRQEVATLSCSTEWRRCTPHSSRARHLGCVCSPENLNWRLALAFTPDLHDEIWQSPASCSRYDRMTYLAALILAALSSNTRQKSSNAEGVLLERRFYQDLLILDHLSKCIRYWSRNCPCARHEGTRGKRCSSTQSYPHHFMGMTGQIRDPVTYPRKESRRYPIGNCVGPKGSLDGLEKRQIKQE